MSANRLKSVAFPSITGLAPSGPMSPEAEHCGAVARDGDEVASARESARGIRIVRDRQARARDPGVCERQVALGETGFRRHDLQLPWSRFLVVFENVLVADKHKNLVGTRTRRSAQLRCHALPGHSTRRRNMPVPETRQPGRTPSVRRP